jgi:outer membrane protein assembly factor BamE (lipoprotein component of BamABCDE complex)
MQEKIKVLSVILGIIALYGCASVGTPIATQNVPKIRKGVTTEAELVQMFGSPTDKSLLANDKTVETWIYTHNQVKGTTFIPYAGAFVGGSHLEIQKLMVYLDRDGKVHNYAFNDSHSEINLGSN